MLKVLFLVNFYVFDLNLVLFFSLTNFKLTKTMTKQLNKAQAVDRVSKVITGLFQEVSFIDKVVAREEIRKGESPDLVGELMGKEGVRVLLIEARVKGEPRIAREAVNALLLEMELWSRACPVFVAPYISSEAAEICRKNNVGHLDLAGNCCLAFDSLFIRTQGHLNPFKSPRKLKSFSKPKSARIIRVLLNNPLREWRTQDLALEAGVSPGMVSNVKKILGDKEWIDGRKKTIALTRPGSLLQEWVKTAPGPEGAPTTYTVPVDFIELENALVAYCGHRGMQCAFTGLSGAVHLTPGIDYRQVQVYISGDPVALAQELGFDQGGDDPNLVLVQAEDQGVFYGTRPVMPASRLQYSRPAEKTVNRIEEEIKTRLEIVSPIQIYHDLKARFKQSDQEADQLFQQVIQPSW